jgi:predicted RNase H-like HicB family nuclease
VGLIALSHFVWRYNHSEGIELHIEGMREDGLPIPEPLTQVRRLAIPA